MTSLIRNFVGGEHVAGGGDRLLSINPSDRSDIVAEVPAGTASDATAAADAAAAAFPGWRALSGPARADYLYAWAEVIRQRSSELADLLTREVGKPIAESRGEVGRCVVILRYYAGEAVRAVGEVVPAQAADALQFTLREPLGAVALITPWNFPLAIPLWKAAPALAFGNTVVLKPAEQASAIAAALIATAADAGLPPGVLNMVTGTGSVIGDALLRADAVRAVSFTGSSMAGAHVAAVCASRNIRFQTEMGGKNAVIVMPDGDVRRAARLTAAGAMRFAGQKCTATSRAIVVGNTDAFLDALREEVAGLPLGPVTDAAAAVGPLITEAARNHALHAITASSGRTLIGGGVPDDAVSRDGFFLEPSVVIDVDPSSSLAQDEIFGPVLAVISARDIDEAIRIANDTRYGLSASLFTSDIASALHYVRRIEAGLVRVNGDTTGVDPHAPFGGMKGSSSGSREQGTAARDFYTEYRTVQVHP